MVFRCRTNSLEIIKVFEDQRLNARVGEDGSLEWLADESRDMVLIREASVYKFCKNRAAACSFSAEFVVKQRRKLTCNQ